MGEDAESFEVAVEAQGSPTARTVVVATTESASAAPSLPPRNDATAAVHAGTTDKQALSACWEDDDSSGAQSGSVSPAYGRGAQDSSASGLLLNSDALEGAANSQQLNANTVGHSRPVPDDGTSSVVVSDSDNNLATPSSSPNAHDEHRHMRESAARAVALSSDGSNGSR